MKRCFLLARRAERSRDESRIASPHFMPGNSYKHSDDARLRKGHVTASSVTSRVRQWLNNWSSVGRSVFPHVRSRVYRRDWSSFTSHFSMGDCISSRWDTAAVSSSVASCEQSSSEDFVCAICSNIWSVWFRKTLIVFGLSAVAKRRLVETENPSACATVCCKWCK
jgi:hypothetical protein